MKKTTLQKMYYNLEISIIVHQNKVDNKEIAINFNEEKSENDLIKRYFDYKKNGGTQTNSFIDYLINKKLENEYNKRYDFIDIEENGVTYIVKDVTSIESAKIYVKRFIRDLSKCETLEDRKNEINDWSDVIIIK